MCVGISLSGGWVGEEKGRRGGEGGGGRGDPSSHLSENIARGGQWPLLKQRTACC